MSARFCWHCGNPLASNAYRQGLYSVTVYDQIGNPHLVHKICARAAAPRQITAAPADPTPYDSPRLHDE